MTLSTGGTADANRRIVLSDSMITLYESITMESAMPMLATSNSLVIIAGDGSPATESLTIRTGGKNGRT